MDRKKKRLLSPLLERTQDALKGQRSMQTLENYHSRIYVGCSQNHPYCGEWLPNQVFRRRGLRPIRGAGHSNSLFQRETDSRERCRHGRSRMENWKSDTARRRAVGRTLLFLLSLSGTSLNTGAGRLFAFIITVNELTVPGLSVRSETYTISDNKTCHILESVCPWCYPLIEFLYSLGLIP